MSRIARLWPVLSGGKKLVPFTDSFAVDGPLGPRWTGATWAISGGKAVNTPNDGAAVTVTNGDMELDSTWINKVTPVSNERSSEQAHGGTYSRKAVGDGSGDGFYQIVGGHTVGAWYVARAWIYVSAGTCRLRTSATAGTNSATPNQTAAEWKLHTITGYASNANREFNFESQTAGAATFYGDDATINALTLAELIASVQTKRSNVTVSAALTVTQCTQTGLILCLDNPANPKYFIYAWHDGLNALLGKCVNGTYTALVSANPAYSAGATIQVVKSGTSVSLYYNGSQVGTTQTVSDAGLMNNTIHGMLSTSALSSIDTFSIT